MGYKVRYGTATIHKDKDTELPDGAFNHVFLSNGPESIDIGFMYPSSKEDWEKIVRSETLHHLLGAYS